MVCLHPLSGRRVCIVEVNMLKEEQVGLWVAKGYELRYAIVDEPLVIGIEEEEVLSLGFVDAGVAGSGESLVGLMDYAHAGVGCN